MTDAQTELVWIPGGEVRHHPIPPSALTVKNAVLLAMGSLAFGAFVFWGNTPDSLTLAASIWIGGALVIRFGDLLNRFEGPIEERFSVDGYQSRIRDRRLTFFRWDDVESVELVTSTGGDCASVPTLQVKLVRSPYREAFYFRSGMGKREWVVCAFPAMSREERVEAIEAILAGTFVLPSFKPVYRRKPYIEFPPD